MYYYDGRQELLDSSGGGSRGSGGGGGGGGGEGRKRLKIGVTVGLCGRMFTSVCTPRPVNSTIFSLGSITS